MLRRRGFSLMEILVVLAIAAFLMTLALPAFQEQMQRSRRLLATTELWELLLRQEQFFTSRRRYALDLAELGLPAGSGYYLDRDGRVQAEPGIYRIEVQEPASGQLRLTATAVGSQATDVRCARLWLTSAGERGVAGGGDSRRCWR